MNALILAHQVNSINDLSYERWQEQLVFFSKRVLTSLAKKSWRVNDKKDSPQGKSTTDHMGTMK